jgi:hypothetical protein
MQPTIQWQSILTANIFAQGKENLFSLIPVFSPHVSTSKHYIKLTDASTFSSLLNAGVNSQSFIVEVGSYFIQLACSAITNNPFHTTRSPGLLHLWQLNMRFCTATAQRSYLEGSHVQVNAPPVSLIPKVW